MSDVFTYDATDWFWLVAESGRIWSSRAGAYVEEDTMPENLTRIADEAELSQVLAPYGLPGPLPRPVEAKWLRAALAMGGLDGAVAEALGALAPEVATRVRVRLDYGLVCDRLDADMDAFGAALGLSAGEVDALWREAEAMSAI